MYAGGYTEMENCQEGWQGVPVYEKCPAKSSMMQLIYSGGKLAGLFTIHYLRKQHTFPEDAQDIMKSVAGFLGLLIGRINGKKAEIARIEAESSNRAKTEFLSPSPSM